MHPLTSEDAQGSPDQHSRIVTRSHWRDWLSRESAQGAVSPRPVTLALSRSRPYPVSVFPDDLIEDVAGVDDVKLPSETTITSFFHVSGLMRKRARVMPR